jgi:hypothetical protein
MFDSRLIRKIDYRKFEYRISPISDEHYEVIKIVHNKVENYFKDRDNCGVERKIYTSDSSRYYTITFALLDDSKLFEFAFAEYITTDGVRYWYE